MKISETNAESRLLVFFTLSEGNKGDESEVGPLSHIVMPKPNRSLLNRDIFVEGDFIAEPSASAMFVAPLPSPSFWTFQHCLLELSQLKKNT